MEAAALDRDPVFPEWTAALPGDWEEDADQTNARIHETYHARAWPAVYQSWKEGYRRLLESGERIAEKDLLDAGRYPWLTGYSLAFVLVASYDHHQEHFEKLVDWLQRHEGWKDAR
jgi:hypothetical protein